MSMFEIFSKRQKRLRGEFPTVLTFDKMDDTLKIQVVHILRDAFGVSRYEHPVERAFQTIIDILSREYGVFTLTPYADQMSSPDQVVHFFMEEKNIEKQLDVIELAVRYVDRGIRDSYSYKSSTERKLEPDDAIAELNERFKEHGLGYAYESGLIIKLDSSYTHAEMTVPALKVLYDGQYSGAMDEFLRAHEHYRHGRNKEAINDCLKSFESVLKTICERRKWPFKETDTAKRLVEICFENELVPKVFQSELGALRAILESGLPPIRNTLTAHGQGSAPKSVDDSLTKFCLNVAAANIRLLGELAQ